MTSADSYLRGDPRYQDAFRIPHGTGAGIQGFRQRNAHGTLTGHIITVLIAGVVAAFVFWWGRS